MVRSNLCQKPEIPTPILVRTEPVLPIKDPSEAMLLVATISLVGSKYTRSLEFHACLRRPNRRRWFTTSGAASPSSVAVFVRLVAIVKIEQVIQVLGLKQSQ